MGSEETKCRVCGQALAGRNRFEGICPACREAEVLSRAVPEGRSVAEGRGEARPPAAAVCPACGATNPAEQAVCERCGAALRARSRFPVALCLMAAVVLLGAGAAALVLWRPAGARRTPVPDSTQASTPGPAPGKPAPAVPAQPAASKPVPPGLADALRQETLELLGLLAHGDYGRVIDNYVQPDGVDFARVERALDDIVLGSAARGFAAWAARRTRAGEGQVTEDLRRAGDPEPEFTAALLAHLVREPAASDAHLPSEDRARSLLRWHLTALLDGLEPALGDVSRIGEARGGCFEVPLACRGPRHAAWLRKEPTRLLWCRMPVGWVLKLGLADRLERVRDVLKRPAPEERPTPRGAGDAP